MNNKCLGKPLPIGVLPYFWRVENQGAQVAEETISISKKEYERLQAQLAFLTQQLADFKRMAFGTKSERFVPSDTGQTQLFEAEQPSKQPEPRLSKTTVRSSPKKQKPVRALLPAHLPRQKEIIEPEGVAPGARKIGEEITELLEYNPAKLFVRRIVRPKYATPGEEGVAIAGLPTLPLPRFPFARRCYRLPR